MRKSLVVALLVPCLLLTVGGKKDKKKKKKGQEEVRVGWVKPSEEAGGSCYYPPAWDDMASGPRGLARAPAIQDVLSQWKGERGDGVTMPEKYAYDLETILLGDPKDIEAIAMENATWCEKRMAGAATDEEWAGWVATLPARLTAGECRGSLLPQEMHDYLNIGGGWHMRMPFCKGETIVIAASTQDYYRVTEKGEWINTIGDTSKSVSGSEWACTLEGCYHGTLVCRFTNYDKSIQQVFPCGDGGTMFTMPDHGHIDLQINDDAWHDNDWKVEGGMQHHTGVSYLPK